MQYRPQWHSSFEKGWSHTPVQFVPFVKGQLYPQDPHGPDELEPPNKQSLWLWPDSTSAPGMWLMAAHVLPFHYPDGDGNWLAEEERYGEFKVLKVYDKSAASDKGVLLSADDPLNKPSK